ncbi:helix-turn-helix transcriptional regulator, partial [Clostridium fallax]
NYEVISGFTKSSKILIISSIESIEQIDKLFNNLIENNILTYCFFSNIYTDLKDLKTAFLESFKAFSSRIFFKSNSLIHFNNINCNKFILPSNLRNDFIVLIKSKNLNKIKDIINNYLNLIDKSKDIMALKSFINDLFAALYYDNLEDKKESLISDIDYLTNNSLYINKNINDLTNFLIKKVELIINSNKIAPLPNSAYTIIRIKDYIDNNFSSQNITLEFLSNKFYINASHLSSIFKKITGDNLVEYTTKKRIEKAKLLLKDSNLKIGQVSEEVGYKDYYYFSKLFKKYVGIPPSKFKNINC